MTGQTAADAAERLVKKGLALAQQGQQAQAFALLGRAVREAPNSAEAWYALALVCPEAERRAYCLERCLKLDPQHQGARRELTGAAGAAGPVGDSCATVAPDTPAALPTTPEETSAPSAAPALASSQPHDTAASAAVPSEASRVATPLAARLAARRGGQEGHDQAREERVEERPRPEHNRVAPPRVPRVAEPPPALRPLTLTTTRGGESERLSDEEIAQAALRQLLRPGAADDSGDQRAATAASIARRYFGSARHTAAPSLASEEQAMRALGMSGRAPRARVAVLMSVLVLVGLLGAALFNTLL